MNEDTLLTTRTGLPDALRVLVAEFPRTTWQTHRNFRGMVEFWLDRHLMFRRLVSEMESDVQAVLDQNMAFDRYAPRLSRYGGMLLKELHSHHNIEDQHYFPQLEKLDPRAPQAFALLESDHGEMDGLLHDMAQAANAVLQGGEAGVFATHLQRFAALLNRHLEDEEDIVVPVILKSGFQG